MPAKIRKHHRIVFQSSADEHFEKIAGILKTKGKLTKAILKERKKEKELEEKKYSK
jgi:hypothetical protein